MKTIEITGDHGPLKYDLRLHISELSGTRDVVGKAHANHCRRPSRTGA
jgi:hypothetical protein